MACGTTTDRPADAFLPEDGATGDVGVERDAGASVEDAALDDATADAGRVRDPYDFDGDGFADVLIGDVAYRASCGAIWIVRGSADGPRAPEVLIEGDPVERLGRGFEHIDDHDGDGALDIGVRDGLGATRSGRWIGSTGATGTLVDTPGSSPLAIVDVDGMEPLDVIAARGCGDACNELLLVTGTTERSIVRGTFSAILAADVIGDARSEVIVVENGPPWEPDRSDVRALDWDGVELASVSVPSELVAIRAIGDLDRDGHVELATGGPADAYVLRFGAEAALTTFPRLALREPQDVDCDGYLDIPLVDRDGGGWIARGSADGPLDAVPAALVPDGTRLSDIDGDGCHDLAVAEMSTPACPFDEYRLMELLAPCAGAVRFYAGSRDGFAEVASVSTEPTVGRAHELVVVDHDVWGRTERGEGFVLRAGDEVATRADVPRADASGDVDADGLVDVIERARDETVLWRNRGDHFERAAAIGAGYEIVGDLDGDGDIDLARVDGGVLELRAGGPRFPDEPMIAALPLPGASTWSRVVAAGDVDGDGLADVLVDDPDRARLFTSRARIAGSVEPMVTLEGAALGAMGDVSGDGFDDLAAFDEDAASRSLTVRLYLGSASGLSTIPVVVTGLERDTVGGLPGNIATRAPFGLLSATATLRPERLTVDGVVPWGEPIALPRETFHEIRWYLEPHGVRGSLLVSTSEADGAVLYRFDERGHDDGTSIRMPEGTARPTFGAFVLGALR